MDDGLPRGGSLGGVGGQRLVEKAAAGREDFFAGALALHRARQHHGPHALRDQRPAGVRVTGALAPALLRALQAFRALAPDLIRYELLVLGFASMALLGKIR